MKKKDEKERNFKDLNDLLNINGRLDEYAKSQKGSRSIQKLIEKLNNEDLNTLIFKLDSSFPALMMDIYGNYLCQKIIQHATSEQRCIILKSVTI